MEKGVNAKPPEWLASIVRLLIPPASREHVLGDLHERLQATGQSGHALGYFRDSMNAVPLVIWSEIRRRSNAALLVSEALVLYAAFASGEFYWNGLAALPLLLVGHTLFIIAIPALVSLAVLTVADVYVSGETTTDAMAPGLFAVAVAGGIDLAIHAAAPHWALGFRVWSWGAMIGAGCLPALRLFARRERENRKLPIAGAARVAELSARADQLAREVRRRTRIGYITTLGLAVAFARIGVLAPNTLARVGAILTAVASLHLAYQLWRGRSSSSPTVGDTSSLTKVYRGQLLRQRDFHAGPAFWLRLAAMIPGYLLLVAGMIQAHPERTGRLIMIGAAFLLFACLGIPLNLRAARRLQEQLDDVTGR